MQECRVQECRSEGPWEGGGRGQRPWTVGRGGGGRGQRSWECRQMQSLQPQPRESTTSDGATARTANIRAPASQHPSSSQSTSVRRPPTAVQRPPTAVQRPASTRAGGQPLADHIPMQAPPTLCNLRLQSGPPISKQLTPSIRLLHADLTSFHASFDGASIISGVGSSSGPGLALAHIVR